MVWESKFISTSISSNTEHIAEGPKWTNLFLYKFHEPVEINV